MCPEYKDNIMAAREVCDVARSELWKAGQASRWAPGDFNVACSTLFGGSEYGSYTGDKEWSKGMGSAGMPNDVARKVVKFGIAGAGSHGQAVRFRDLANSNHLKATCVDRNGFEVTTIIPPDAEVKVFYQQHASDLKPIGRLRARAWRDPGMPDEDLSPHERQGKQEGMQDNTRPPAEYEFFVEESVLKFCFVGMKVDAAIWELNCVTERVHD